MSAEPVRQLAELAKNQGSKESVAKSGDRPQYWVQRSRQVLLADCADFFYLTSFLL